MNEKEELNTAIKKIINDEITIKEVICILNLEEMLIT